jgi:hypothetical protein
VDAGAVLFEKLCCSVVLYLASNAVNGTLRSRRSPNGQSAVISKQRHPALNVTSLERVRFWAPNAGESTEKRRAKFRD